MLQEILTKRTAGSVSGRWFHNGNGFVNGFGKIRYLQHIKIVSKFNYESP